MKRILIFILIITAVPLMAEKIYRVLSRGAVLDRSTGLVWTRCPLSADGKPIYDFNCKGSKKLYTYDEAMAACNNLTHDGRSDWRLPTIRELQSIVYFYHKPTISGDFSQAHGEVFPQAVTTDDLSKDYLNFFGTPVYCFFNTCYQHYWSSTTYISNVNLAWAINFYSGMTQWDTKVKYKSVRCVAGP